MLIDIECDDDYRISLFIDGHTTVKDVITEVINMRKIEDVRLQNTSIASYYMMMRVQGRSNDILLSSTVKIENIRDSLYKGKIYRICGFQRNAYFPWENEIRRSIEDVMTKYNPLLISNTSYPVSSSSRSEPTPSLMNGHGVSSVMPPTTTTQSTASNPTDDMTTNITPFHNDAPLVTTAAKLDRQVNQNLPAPDTTLSGTTTKKLPATTATMSTRSRSNSATSGQSIPSKTIRTRTSSTSSAASVATTVAATQPYRRDTTPVSEETRPIADSNPPLPSNSQPTVLSTIAVEPLPSIKESIDDSSMSDSSSETSSSSSSSSDDDSMDEEIAVLPTSDSKTVEFIPEQPVESPEDLLMSSQGKVDDNPKPALVNIAKPELSSSDSDSDSESSNSESSGSSSSDESSDDESSSSSSSSDSESDTSSSSSDSSSASDSPTSKKKDEIINSIKAKGNAVLKKAAPPALKVCVSLSSFS
jgi:hypothetical protein